MAGFCAPGPEGAGATKVPRSSGPRMEWIRKRLFEYQSTVGFRILTYKPLSLALINSRLPKSARKIKPQHGQGSTAKRMLRMDSGHRCMNWVP